MDQITEVYVPRWAAIVYGVMAIALVPWIFGLAINLPSRHTAEHWDAVWVGFDIIMLIVLLLTLYFAFKKLVWVALSATALAMLFIIDAWFDILTSKSGREQLVAIVFGFGEIALALLTFKLVHHVIHHSTPKGHKVHLRARSARNDG